MIAKTDDIIDLDNKGNPTPQQSNSRKSSPKKRSYFFYLIFFIIIILVCLMLWHDFGPEPTYISPTTISVEQSSDGRKELRFTLVDGSKMAINGNGVEEWKNNSTAEIYYSTSQYITYDFYVAVAKVDIPSNKVSGGYTTCKIRVTKITDKVSNNYDYDWAVGRFTFSKPASTSGDPADIYNWLSYIAVAKSNIKVEKTIYTWMILQYLPTILMIVIFVWIAMKTLKGGLGVGMGGGDDNVFSIGKSQAKLVRSGIKFSDVAGIQEEKDELLEIVDYLKRPMKYAAMGARTPKGVMLYGPPGTGKTLLAKAVAGEADVPFFQVSGSAFEDMLVGVGAKRVRDLFAKARKSSPAIIFIDEIDSVAAKRGKFDMSGGGGIADQTINQLLAEMDGFSTKSGIVVIAATNRIDVLDEAILRPGRFDRHIQVYLPDIKEREDILKIHSRNKNISSSISFIDIARRTPGMSGAQLENILNEATLLAVRKNNNVIHLEDIDEAIDRVIAGPAKKTRVISEEERRHIAIHEAGHALVGLYTNSNDVVEKITIIPRGMAAGYTITNPEKQEKRIQTKSELLNMVSCLLGGRAAEEVSLGKDMVSTGASNDLYRASSIVRSMVMQLGMTDTSLSQLIPTEGTTNAYAQKLYSEDTAKKADLEVESIIKSNYKSALDIIKKNQKELDLIVESLLVLETILRSDIDYIHKNKKLPQSVIDYKASKIDKKSTKKSD